MSKHHRAALLLSLSAACSGAAVAQTLVAIHADPGMQPQPQQPVTMQLQLHSPGGRFWCGLHVDFGDGTGADYRLEDARSLAITHAYAAPGTFQVRAEGRTLMRGLRSAGPCTVAAAPLAVSVVDLAARRQSEAEAQLKQRELEEAARLREAEARRQSLEAREVELRAREAELKARELRAREAALRQREEELQRQQAISSARPAPPPARRDAGNLDVFK